MLSTSESFQLSGDSLLDIPTSISQRGLLPCKFGRYQLLRMLGIGGMGTVYLAEDTALQRQVALKIPNRISDDLTRRRLREEARTAAKVCHPNVCAIFDIGLEQDQPYFTMEFIDGKPLSELIADGSTMHPLVIAKMINRIAAGLQAAHKQGVIHRDLKPANILVRETQRPVITDFGLALRQGNRDPKLPGDRILGSPAYMSPEQVIAEESAMGPATDIYGLGAIMYELLTGRRPFDGAVPSVYAQVLKQSPIAPSRLVPGIDPRLESVCLRAMAKNPADRFQDVLALRQSLARYLQNPQPVSRVSPTRGMPVSVGARHSVVAHASAQ